jgi:glutamate-1-semialdehyde 2,1-aminomutase
MFGIVFAEAAPTDYRGWVDTDHELYDAVAWQMILRGAMPEPDSREPWFLSEAHASGDIVDRVTSIFELALDAALEARAGVESSHSPANRPTAGQATG